MLLSWSDLIRLGITPENFPNISALVRGVASGDLVKRLAAKFKDVISDLLLSMPTTTGNLMWVKLIPCEFLGI